VIGLNKPTKKKQGMERLKNFVTPLFSKVGLGQNDSGQKLRKTLELVIPEKQRRQKEKNILKRLPKKWQSFLWRLPVPRMMSITFSPRLQNCSTRSDA